MGRVATREDYRTAVAKAMPEAELEENIRQLCKHLRLLRYHTHLSKHSPAGFPDDVYVGPGGVAYAELKREGEDPTPAQQEWIDALRQHGHTVYVWRPSDWLSGDITRALTALSTRR